MYFVKYGQDYLHDPRVEGYELYDLKLTCEENTFGYCDFTIYPSHPSYGKLKERDSVNAIEVYDDDECVFSGYIYEMGKDFYNEVSVKCKGDLDYLNDSVIRPYATYSREYGNIASSTVSGFFEWLINQHNAQVPPSKQFVVGINQGNYFGVMQDISVSNDLYPTTMDELTEVLLNNFGGYIRVRKVDGIRYIDYIHDWADTSTQILDFGVNLTDFSQEDNSEKVASAVIPIGAQMMNTRYDYPDGYYETGDPSPATGTQEIKIGDTYRSLNTNGRVFRTVSDWRTKFNFDERTNILGKGLGSWDAVYVKARPSLYPASAITLHAKVYKSPEGNDLFRWAVTTSDTHLLEYIGPDGKNISPVSTSQDPYQLATGTFRPQGEHKQTLIQDLIFNAPIPANTDIYVVMWGTSNSYGNIHLMDKITVSYSNNNAEIPSAKTYYTLEYEYEECGRITVFVPDVKYYEVDGNDYKLTEDTKPDINKDYFYRKKSYTAQEDITKFEKNVTYYEYDPSRDESALPLTIAPLNESQVYEVGYVKNSDYIYNVNAVNTYGLSFFQYSDADLVTREDVLKQGYLALKSNISPIRTIEIKAIDMHLINPEVESIKIGDYVRVRSVPHNFDGYLLCRSVDLNLNSPADSVYTLGTTYDTLTGEQNKRINILNKTINTQYEATKLISEEAKESATMASEKSDSAINTIKPVVESYESGELNAVSLSITSSKGIVYKDSNFSTVLSVAIYVGNETITDISALVARFGSTARIQWYWQKPNDSEYGIILPSDPKIFENGFELHLNADDLDVKVDFKCELII